MTLGEDFFKRRQVIPRWYPYSLAKYLGLLSVKNKVKEVEEPAFDEKVISWESGRSIAHASDLVGNALVLNRFKNETAQEAAKYIIQQNRNSPKLIFDLAEVFLKKDSSPLYPDNCFPQQLDSIYGEIASLKRKLRDYPRNPILWMNLAFYYCAIAQVAPAAKAVKTALSLNKTNRYLLLSGSRFFLHAGEPDVALSFLRDNDVNTRDPWISAAEIAIADAVGRSSRNIKSGKSLLDSGHISDFDLSELASAIGTIEINAGSSKKGKKYFKRALIEPTENAMAQVVFLQNILRIPPENLEEKHLKCSFEAETRLKSYEGDFEGALESAKNWMALQPFSSKPAVAASYIAGTALGNYEDAIALIKRGLISSPNNPLLKNNLAFSLASIGMLSDAKEILSTIPVSGLESNIQTTILATNALILFRSGNLDEGRLLYKEAVTSFAKEQNVHSEILAKFFWAREENRVNPSLGAHLKEEILKQAKAQNVLELLTPVNKN